MSHQCLARMPLSIYQISIEIEQQPGENGLKTSDHVTSLAAFSQELSFFS
jgi:hypothetical protein